MFHTFACRNYLEITFYFSKFLIIKCNYRLIYCYACRTWIISIVMLLYLVELDLNSACFFFSGHDLLKLTGIISELFSTFHTILTCIQTCNIVMENLLQLCGRVPQLKGARHFSFVEITKSTNNFSEANHIGSGGYRMASLSLFSCPVMVVSFA